MRVIKYGICQEAIAIWTGPLKKNGYQERDLFIYNHYVFQKEFQECVYSVIR